MFSSARENGEAEDKILTFIDQHKDNNKVFFILIPFNQKLFDNIIQQRCYEHQMYVTHFN